MKYAFYLLPLALGVVWLGDNPGVRAADDAGSKGLEYQIPDERLKTPFKDEIPIVFINRSQNAREWDKLTAFWNEATESAVDPKTLEPVTRKVVRIRVPLGLTQNPPIPAENPMTVAKVALGKRLYFDTLLSSDNTVACASCHHPQRGYTDQSPVSSGIKGLKGGVSAPTVLNSAFHTLQFWDGRAGSLEDQAQGPVQNPIEMFDGEGHAWNKAVLRLRSRPEYVQAFRAVFGTEPTRDGAAKAIAAYERLVLNGNSIHDRADLAMRKRVDDEESGKYVYKAVDYKTVLDAAFKNRDRHALTALGLDMEKDAGRTAELGQKLAQGREVFFGKARCNSCHVGDNFTDNSFHNLGVGVKEGNLPADGEGRFARLATGHKNPELMGAFKTPTVRGLVGTAPYMHDGVERTLEQVVDFYDRGGNVNEFLDTKMRDFEAEKAYELSRRNKTPYTGPEVKLFGKSQKAVVPLKLNLTPDEKAALVLFLRALEGDAVDSLVADPERSIP